MPGISPRDGAKLLLNGVVVIYFKNEFKTSLCAILIVASDSSNKALRDNYVDQIQSCSWKTNKFTLKVYFHWEGGGGEGCRALSTKPHISFVRVMQYTPKA